MDPIRTPRLILRSFSVSDAEAIFAIFSDEEMNRFLPWFPVKTMDEAVDLVNAYAPEHLIIQANEYRSIAERIINAGSVFLGSYSTESAGDYASGTNHTLPTNGYARAYSGVCLDSFIRKITFQEITPVGLQHIGPSIQEMAANEHLDAHKNAVTVRMENLKRRL